MASRRNRNSSSKTSAKQEGTKPDEERVLNIVDLAECPWQAESQAAYSDAERAALIESMRREGQRDPIDVLPAPNVAGFEGLTILDGHERVAAALVLGWAQINAIIRHSMTSLSERELHVRFLEFNKLRRHLPKIDRVRAVIARYGLEQKADRSSLRLGWTFKRLVERVQTEVNDSKRNCQRYVNILLALPGIANAFRDGRLGLIKADEIARADEKRQREFLRRLKGCKTSTEGNHLAAQIMGRPTCPEEMTIWERGRRFQEGLERILPYLEDCDLDPIRRHVSIAMTDVLQRVNTIAGDLLGHWDWEYEEDEESAVSESLYGDETDAA